MIATGVALTTAEFDITWHELGLGRIPYPLEVPSVGGTAQQRAEEADRVRRTLRDRGLRPETPDSELAVLLGVLGNAKTSVDAVGHLGGPLRALASDDGRSGVLAVLGRDGRGVEIVRLTAIRPDTLAESIVDTLSPVPPGRGCALSVPVGSLSGGERGNGAYRHDEIELAELITGRVAGGQFGVTVRSRDGMRHRAPTLVAWFDTPGGRYLVVREGGWLSLAPADNQRIAHRIDEALAMA